MSAFANLDFSIPPLDLVYNVDQLLKLCSPSLQGEQKFTNLGGRVTFFRPLVGRKTTKGYFVSRVLFATPNGNCYLTDDETTPKLSFKFSNVASVMVHQNLEDLVLMFDNEKESDLWLKFNPPTRTKNLEDLPSRLPTIKLFLSVLRWHNKDVEVTQKVDGDDLKEMVINLEKPDTFSPPVRIPVLHNSTAPVLKPTPKQPQVIEVEDQRRLSLSTQEETDKAAAESSDILQGAPLAEDEKEPQLKRGMTFREFVTKKEKDEEEQKKAIENDPLLQPTPRKHVDGEGEGNDDAPKDKSEQLRKEGDEDRKEKEEELNGSSDGAIGNTAPPLHLPDNLEPLLEQSQKEIEEEAMKKGSEEEEVGETNTSQSITVPLPDFRSLEATPQDGGLTPLQLPAHSLNSADCVSGGADSEAGFSTTFGGAGSSSDSRNSTSIPGMDSLNAANEEIDPTSDLGRALQTLERLQETNYRLDAHLKALNQDYEARGGRLAMNAHDAELKERTKLREKIDYAKTLVKNGDQELLTVESTVDGVDYRKLARCTLPELLATTEYQREMNLAILVAAACSRASVKPDSRVRLVKRQNTVRF